MKKLIYLILVLVFVGGTVFLLQSKVRRKTDAQKSIKETTGSDIKVPSDLVSCTAELVAQNCDGAELKTVCGYDHTIYESGEKRDNVLQFKSACHYCKFYGLEEKDVGGTRIKGFGYENKPCNQGMYKN